MSWSVSYTGTPAEAKVALAPQFAASKESTANIPHEQTSVGKVEDVVNDQLDFLAEHAADRKISVSAGGAAGVAPEDAPWKSYSQVFLRVDPYFENMPTNGTLA